MAHMQTKIGEYAIIVNAKHEFLMLKLPSSTHPSGYTWHFPGGRLNDGEEAVEGLIREVKEETNLEIYDLKPIFTKIFTSERKYGVFFIAKVKELYKVKISDEHLGFKWFKENEIDAIEFWQPFYKKMLKENL